MRRIMVFFISMIFAILYSLFNEFFCLEPYPGIYCLLCVLTFDVGRLHERLDKMERKKDEH
jgi:hypothetical protein